MSLPNVAHTDLERQGPPAPGTWCFIYGKGICLTLLALRPAGAGGAVPENALTTTGY